MRSDVCLILEGTYPYVHGGVSSWIHELVTGMPELTFSIIHLSATGDVLHTPRYDIPHNIIEFREAFLHDFEDDRSRTRGRKEEGWDTIRRFYGDLGRGDFSNFEKFYEIVINKNTRRLNFHDINFSRKGWDMMLEFYNSVAPDASFIDFYWTMRFIHIPILNLFNADIPEASVYHTVCTGYAGLLASIAKISRKKPMILTEHGIYTYERKIDISRSSWIYSGSADVLRATRTLGFFKDFWINKFELLSKLTYECADQIITLFEGNRRIQIEGGADPAKTRIIPNGVCCNSGAVRVEREKRGTHNVGFVGRVVSIKDVKMLIRAVKIVKGRIKNIKVYIMGSCDEEPDYAEECKLLVKTLDLEKEVIFKGVVNVHEYFPELDVMVLTSISEAQPLSILEAMCYGIPVVSTDVGSCRELLMGMSREDAAIGEAGIITRIGDPYETGRGIIKILESGELAEKMSRAGKERAKRHYSKSSMIESYRALYKSYLEQS